MPKKYAREDVQGWSDQEVLNWLHSQKGLRPCLPDFESVNGLRLLSMTNDDLKNLPSVAGNDKKRKALKKALSQLPGNSVASKSKTKVAGNKSSQKPPPPTQYLPPSSFEPVPPPPSLPPPTSTFHPPQSPNSATYSDPSILFPGDDAQQEVYDNPIEVRDEMAPPPLPPHPNYFHQQLGANYEENAEDDQMIYDQYDEEEEEIFDSSFASEEEEEGEDTAAAVNGLDNASPQASHANIRAISAKFFAEGLTAHTGISTVATPPTQPKFFGQMEQIEEQEDDDIYDLPPEELKLHPPPPNILPPVGPPPGSPEEGEEGDIYDIVEEVVQRPLGYSGSGAPPPPNRPPTEDGDQLMIYDTATAEEQVPPSLPPHPPTYPSETSANPPAPMRPPKPGFNSSPALPHKFPSPPQPARPAMRKPIGSTAASSLPTQSPVVPHQRTVETTSDPVPAPPPPPPPPTANSSVSSSSPAWSRKKDPPISPGSTSPHSNTPAHVFGSGGRISDRLSPDLQSSRTQTNKVPSPSLECKFPKPLSPGRFVDKQLAALKPSAMGQEDKREASRPAIANKPLSIQDRIKMLNKPGEDGGGRKTPLQKPPEGISPCTGRRMKKKSSVSDLINYHSNSSASDGEGRTLSPEHRPSLPPKPFGASPKHESPRLKRRLIGQENASPPTLPERPSDSPSRQPPAWKKTVSREQPVQESWKKRTESAVETQPSWKMAEETQPSWKKAAETQPSWKKAAETQPSWKKAEETQPSWKETQPLWKKAEETQPSWKKAEETQPSWKKAEETQPSWKKAEETQPSWKKAEETQSWKETQPSWKKAAETQPSWKKAEEMQPSWKETQPSWKNVEETQPSWKKAEETQPSWKKSEEAQPSRKRSGEEKAQQSIHQRWKRREGEEEEEEKATPHWKQREETKPELPQKREPATPPDDSSRPTFTYKPYKSSKAAAMSPPPIPEPETPPPMEPPRSRMSSRAVPSPPSTPAKDQPQLPPRPPKFSDRPSEQSPHDLPPPLTRRSFEAAPDCPQLPQRPPPRQRPPSAEEPVGQRLPPRPPKGHEAPQPVLPSQPQQQSGSPVGHSWYHANLKDRKIAESRLMKYTKDGTFIIRDSSRTAGEYSLSLLYHGAVKHLRIRLRADGQYVLGEEKVDEVPFSSVVELVNFHKKEPLVLKSGGEITLRYECPH